MILGPQVGACEWPASQRGKWSSSALAHSRPAVVLRPWDCTPQTAHCSLHSADCLLPTAHERPPRTQRTADCVLQRRQAEQHASNCPSTVPSSLANGRSAIVGRQSVAKTSWPIQSNLRAAQRSNHSAAPRRGPKLAEPNRPHWATH